MLDKNLCVYGDDVIMSMVSFEELRRELITQGAIDSIANVDGIYKVYIPDGFEV